MHSWIQPVLLVLVAAWTASGCALPHANVRGDASRSDVTIDAVADATDAAIPMDAPLDVRVDVGPDAPACEAGTLSCGDRCVMASNDPLNCGRCGNACPAGGPNQSAVCNGGTCELRCDMGFASCDGNAMNGCEVDIRTSAAHCGRCGNACSAAGGSATCSAGMCGITCDPGLGDCDRNAANGCEARLDRPDSIDNCRACGTRCALEMRRNAVATCGMRGCEYPCLPGFGDCDGNPMNGCEARLDSVTNCGRCGRGCSGTTPVCDTAGMGMCVSGCTAPAVRCGESCVDTTSSTMHCGTCGNACSLPNATPVCRSGACAIGTCNPGYADCDGNPMNGCEVNVQTDTGNCGMCRRPCTAANGTATCTSGVCQVATCNANFANCNMLAADGCEVDLRSSTANCGACGTVCGFANAAALCTAGMCRIGTCTAGFSNCDGDPGNGCELNTASNVMACGTCTTVCSSAGGTASCAMGTCGITCSANRGNCNGVVSDGCETDLASSVSHCGRCGAACGAVTNGTPACTASTCGIGMCSAGFGNCDGLAANGCEAPLNSTMNCGACGRACTGATPVCNASMGMCVSGCPAGQVRCGMSCVDTSVDVSNCGACGTACGMMQICTAGSCAMCPAGQARCSGNTCTDLQGNMNNCGACGRICAAGTTCASGACVCGAGTTACGGSPGMPRFCCSASQECSMGMCVMATPDAGAPDAGEPDAGAPDAGPDGGAPDA